MVVTIDPKTGEELHRSTLDHRMVIGMARVTEPADSLIPAWTSVCGTLPRFEMASCRFHRRRADQESTEATVVVLPANVWVASAQGSWDEIELTVGSDIHRESIRACS